VVHSIDKVKEISTTPSAQKKGDSESMKGQRTKKHRVSATPDERGTRPRIKENGAAVGMLEIIIVITLEMQDK
jgi:hypothetical protein